MKGFDPLQMSANCFTPKSKNKSKTFIVHMQDMWLSLFKPKTIRKLFVSAIYNLHLVSLLSTKIKK